MPRKPKSTPGAAASALSRPPVGFAAPVQFNAGAANQANQFNVGAQACPAPEPAKSPTLIFNCVKGTTLHLGDGRTLLHGEGAEVSAELAAELRERGQAE